MEWDKVKLAVSDGIATVRLHDPDKLNALSLQMIDDIDECFDYLENPDSNVRAVIITGSGRGFCSGFDMSSVGDFVYESALDMMELTAPKSIGRLRRTHLPIVTAVNDLAAGVGSSIALLGDIVIAGESSYFMQAFRHRGLVPDGGATYLLSRLAGKARAMEMLLMGDKVPAAKALEWGLINQVVPDVELLDTAIEIARKLATGPMSLGLIRRQVWDALDLDWEEALHGEARAQDLAADSHDAREGVRAFLEKRVPVFTGR